MKNTKKNILLIVLMLFVTTTYARPIYIYHKEGGKFNIWGFYIGYKIVDQKVDSWSTDAAGNPVEIYSITCKEPGRIKCKYSGASGIIRMDKDNSFDAEFFKETLDKMNEAIDDIVINKKEFVGTMTKKINIVSLEGNRCILVFTAVWRMISEESGQVQISVEQLKTDKL